MSSISLSARLEFKKVALRKPHEVHCLVTLEGSKPKATARKPLGIGVAIDCSGSMSEDQGRKIEYAKRSLLKLIDHLTDEDTLGVVAFSDSVWTVVSPTKIGTDAKERAKAEVSKLHPVSNTNLSGALLEAYGSLREASGDVLRAFLFTDGLPTAGECDKAALVEMASRRPNDRVGLTAFGYGSNHDPELLMSMAKKGGGNFYFVRTPDECPAFFGRELGGLLSCVAQSIKVRISTKPDVRILEVLNDLDVDANKDRTKAAITVDDVYAGEKRRVLLRLALPEMEKSGRPFRLGSIQAEFQDLLSKEPRAEECDLSVEYVKPEEADTAPDKEVEEQIAVQRAAKAQEEAVRLASAGNFAGAQAVVQRAANECKTAGTAFACLVAADLEKNVQPWLRSDAFHQGGAHYLHANAYGYRHGRGATAGSAGLYDTPDTKGMADSFAQDTGTVPPAPPEAPSLTKRRTSRP